MGTRSTQSSGGTAAARLVAAITAAPRRAFLAKPGRDGLGGAPHLFAHNAVAVLAACAAAHDADTAGWVVMRVVAPPAHASAVLELPDEADHSPLASPFAPAAAAGAATGSGTLCAVRLPSRAPRAPSAVRLSSGACFPDLELVIKVLELVINVFPSEEPDPRGAVCRPGTPGTPGVAF